MSSVDLLVAGGSYAGLAIAAGARAAGFPGTVLLVSDEPHLPYHRPPLSKAFLGGDGTPDSLALRPRSFLEANAIAFAPSTRLDRIEREARVAHLSDGRRIAYGRLALALGSRARALDVPGASLRGVRSLRTLDDAVALRDSLVGAGEFVIVGGGFIGLEIAASLRRRGCRVTVVESQPRLMSRALPAVMGEYLAERHRREGVEFRLGAQVAAFEGDAGALRAVRLADGSRLPADGAIVGIGAIPNTGIAAASGLHCDNGIVVDENGATSDPHVFAAGDCTAFHSPHAGRSVRLECVQNANDQGRAAGHAIAGRPAPYRNPPWFWSDQFDLKLQGVGFSMLGDTHVVRGDIEGTAFSVFYFRAGRLVAAESINRPAEHLLARRLLAAGSALTPAQAADESFDLKQLAPR